jgi:NAD(P)-dependent dehydrogenase (short-subunit alcohol dehydrogenase family)
LAPRVRVNGVAPGPILPPRGESAETFALRGTNNSLQKVGRPADVAEAVLYLAQASFVTGEILHVTGGEQFRAAR